jgi:NAD(P)-dependent dehydrogenase (short-subunit alcohol dehydrogenase family)
VRLKGKVAIVTGGAAGIGRATAALFAREGARVTIGDIDRPRGEATAAEITAAGGDCLFVPCDVAQAAETENLVRTTVAARGRLHILINNAALLSGFGNVIDCSLEDWNRSIGIGLTGMFLCSKYAVPAMSEGGSIINLASVGAVLPFPDQAPYVTIKAGVIQLTRSMAIDFGRRRIRVNAIAPGAIDTHPVTEEHLRFQIARSVLGRKGRPEDVAQAALFLCSDEATFITGVCLPVDGGYLLGKFR